MFQLSQLIVNSGGVAAVIDYIGDSQSNVRLPGIMMLGYVAAHSENLAMAVIVSKVKALSRFKKRYSGLEKLQVTVRRGYSSRTNIQITQFPAADFNTLHCKLQGQLHHGTWS